MTATVAAALIKIPSPEWEELQMRRAELISRKNFGHGDLSREEIKELDFLNSRSREAINAAFPAPSGAMEKLAEIVARIEQQQYQQQQEEGDE